MNVPVEALIAEAGPSIRVSLFAEESHSYVFKLYTHTLFGDFESPAAVMFADELLLCDDGSWVPAFNAESALTALRGRFRKVDYASL